MKKIGLSIIVSILLLTAIVYNLKNSTAKTKMETKRGKINYRQKKQAYNRKK